MNLTREAEQLIEAVKADINDIANRTDDLLRKSTRSIQDELRPPPGPHAIFHHTTHALERIKDVQCVLNRMFEGRSSLLRLDAMRQALRSEDHPDRVPLPEEFSHQADKVEHGLKLDFESLFIFGHILLDQWMMFAAYAVGEENPEECTFTKVVHSLASGNPHRPLCAFWQSHREDLLWLYAQVTLYRNHFIVHAERPWQRSRTHTLYGLDYQLFTPSPPGWVNEQKIAQEIEGLLHLAPTNIQRLPEDHWQRTRPRALLEVLIGNIGKIEDHEDIKKILNIARRYGYTTPSFHVVGRRLLQFLLSATERLVPLVLANIDKVILGSPVETAT